MEIRGDEASRAVVPEFAAASEEDWGKEYLDYILSCKRDRIYRGHDLRGLLRYEDRMHTLGVDILYPFEQD